MLTCCMASIGVNDPTTNGYSALKTNWLHKTGSPGWWSHSGRPRQVLLGDDQHTAAAQDRFSRVMINIQWPPKTGSPGWWSTYSGRPRQVLLGNDQQTAAAQDRFSWVMINIQRPPKTGSPGPWSTYSGRPRQVLLGDDQHTAGWVIIRNTRLGSLNTQNTRSGFE